MLGDYKKRQSLSLLGSPCGIGGKRIWHRKRDRGLCRNGGNVWNVRAGGIVGAHLDRIGGAIANHHPKIVYVCRNEPDQFPDGYSDVCRSGLELKEIHVDATIATSAQGKCWAGEGVLVVLIEANNLPRHGSCLAIGCERYALASPQQ